MRFLFFVFLWLNTNLLLTAKPEVIRIDASHRSFLTHHCVDCHNAKKTKGKLNLDVSGLSFEINDIKTADMWQHVLGAINAKEMPPEDEPQPSEEEKAIFLEMLSDKIVLARRALSDAGRITVMRRLNQREYQNTLSDLLGIPIDASHMPSDEEGEQFNTDGSSLFVSAGQLQEYLQFARESIRISLETYAQHESRREVTVPGNIHKVRMQKDLDACIEKYERALAFEADANPDKDPGAYGFNSARHALGAKIEYNRDYQSLKDYVSHPLSERGTLIGTFRSYSRTSMPFRRDERPLGYYSIKAKVSKLEDSPQHRSFLNLGFLDKSSNDIALSETFHVYQSPKQPQLIETRVFYDGQHENLSFKDKPSFRKEGESRLSFLIEELHVEGPLSLKAPYLVQEVLNTFKETPLEDQVRQLLHNLAQVVFRYEEPDSAYLNGLYRVYTKKLKAGLAPRQAIIEPLAMMFTSPGFLYLSEVSLANKSRPLSPRELAVRLAYFLWNGPPDERLYQLAATGELKYPKVLGSEMTRMLEDSKSERFLSSFVYQWLDMHRLGFFKFDLNQFHHFDETMKLAVGQEVIKTFATVLRENLPLERLLKSDFVVINAMLAKHYGIEGVKGSEFRKVNLQTSSYRGGLTGMAAIHAMGSNGVESSPVERGVWVLRHILNQPPPPAPANVPQLSRNKDKPLSTRELHAAHQEEAQCAHCHNKIDPIGFGLENFDPVGLWRQHEIHNDKWYKINPAGALHRGPEFKSYADLRDIFVERKAAFKRGMIEHLLSYALGRHAGFSDESTFEQIEQRMSAEGDTLASLVRAIVMSDLFLSKN